MTVAIQFLGHRKDLLLHHRSAACMSPQPHYAYLERNELEEQSRHIVWAIFFVTFFCFESYAKWNCWKMCAMMPLWLLQKELTRLFRPSPLAFQRQVLISSMSCSSLDLVIRLNRQAEWSARYVIMCMPGFGPEQGNLPFKMILNIKGLKISVNLFWLRQDCVRSIF